MNLEILIKRGLGELRFGSSHDEVKALLGEPCSVDAMSPIVAEYISQWRYNDPDLRLSFRVDQDSTGKLTKSHHLVLISTESERVRLFGECVVGQSEEFVRTLMERHGCGEVISVTHPLAGHSLDVPSSNFKALLSEGIVTSIQWTHERRKESVEGRANPATNDSGH